jgi:hypothetical protein
MSEFLLLLKQHVVDFKDANIENTNEVRDILKEICWWRICSHGRYWSSLCSNSSNDWGRLDGGISVSVSDETNPACIECAEQVGSAGTPPLPQS